MLLFLLIITVTGLSADECPASCECKEFPGPNIKIGDVSTTVTCNGNLNLTQNFPATTDHIILKDVSEADVRYVFDFIKANRSCLSRFNRLTVTESTITDLLNVTLLPRIENLTSLELSSCQIEELLFAFNTSDLLYLNLARNKVKIIQNDTFGILTEVKVLNLSANLISTIECKGFDGLDNLRVLDLSHNSLNILSYEVLLPLVSLEQLNLSGNHLEVLDEACFSSLQRLQQLDVSWNRLTHVAPGGLHLPSLARLTLAGNQKLGGSREPTLLVGMGVRLQTVDVSRTGLKQVPSSLTHSVRTLRLSGNSIKAVHCGDLDSYPILQLLDCSANELELIEDDALGRLESLFALYLGDNKLRTIPKSLPEHLKTLHLERNRIISIQTEDLATLNQLEVLVLKENVIESIEDNAFSALESLSTLDLSKNPIKTLPPGCLLGPSQLRILRMAEVPVISPAEDATFPLSAPEHLITLDLSGSRGLVRQLLTDTATLAASKELQELDLSNGGVSNVRSDLLLYLPQLRFLQLKDNPINCTDLYWLSDWMRKQDEEGHRNAVCEYPPDFWGTPVIDLQSLETFSTTKAPILTTVKRHSLILNNTAFQLKNDVTVERVASINESYVNATLKNGDKKIENLSSLRFNTTYYSNNFGGDLFRNKENIKVETPDVISGSNITSSVLPAKNIKEIRDDGIPQGQKFIWTNQQSATVSSREYTVKNISETIKDEYSLRVKKENITNISSNDIKPLIETTGQKKMQNTLIISRGKSLNKNISPLKMYENDIFSKQEEYTWLRDEMKHPGNTITPPISNSFTPTRAAKFKSERNEDVTSPETSMYSGENRTSSRLLHPGMLIMTVGILGIVAVMATLNLRLKRRKRTATNGGDVEVSSLQGVTELW